jgi:hypothetical protein|nr:MAG TPA: hypothetical protein [Caudoviricetes sp.]
MNRIIIHFDNPSNLPLDKLGAKCLTRFDVKFEDIQFHTIRELFHSAGYTIQDVVELADTELRPEDYKDMCELYDTSGYWSAEEIIDMFLGRTIAIFDSIEDYVRERWYLLESVPENHRDEIIDYLNLDKITRPLKVANEIAISDNGKVFVPERI